MKSIKLFIIALGVSVMSISAGYLAFSSSVSALSPSSAGNFAALTDDACRGVRQLDPSQGCGAADSSFKKIVKRLVNLLSYIIGIAAVFMIMISGFKYLTSGGEAAKVESSKNGLIYAVVGLIIVALAQFLVRVVLSTVNA